MGYKYKRKDFGELDVFLRHMDIYLNFRDGIVHGKNTLVFEAKKKIDKIELDATDLKIISIEWLKDKEGNISQILDYEYKNNKIFLKFPDYVNEGEEFYIRTQTECVPSDNILEGIYKDTTPEGAPQQYISQCQQWGFQRILPVIDDCRAKCTMKTTIEADSRYTHLISNGDICKKTNPKGKPIINGTRQKITYENKIPMAPYLFIVAVGTWDELVDFVTLANGHKVRLEYLVPKGRKDDAKIPMKILKSSVLWIEKTQMYSYTGEVYRTICMDKSNFGGMENVGNTTIVTDAALIDEHTLDQSLIYSYAVIVHEFEHNQCGSETTMETPFDMWLNEAYTVNVERDYLAENFNPAMIRLNQVSSIRSPTLGPLAIEDSGASQPIAREGFNHPDELVDGLTYIKAAEVIRMLKLILEKDKFIQAKTNYFNKFKYGNANTEQFFECFESVYGGSLAQFKESWLFCSGYPKLTAKTNYEKDKRKYKIILTQEQDTLYHLPFRVALVDENGKDIAEKIVEITQKEETIIFEKVNRPLFVSLNRDYSFYGTLSSDVTKKELKNQAMFDNNQFNKVEAIKQLTDIERIKLLKNIEADVDEEWINIMGELINADLPSSIKAKMLEISEAPLDRKYLAWYPEQVAAREKLMKIINMRFRDELLQQYNAIDTYNTSLLDGIEERMLKSVLLGFIATQDSEESHNIIKEHYKNATTANDRVVALALLNKSTAKDRREILDSVYEKWKNHLSGYANYLRIISSGTHKDVFDEIKIEETRKRFDMTQPTHTRALFLPAVFNNKIIWTEKGLTWLRDTIIKLAKINPYTAGRALSVFQQVKNLKRPWQKIVMKHLKLISEECKKIPSIHGQATNYMSTVKSRQTR